MADRTSLTAGRAPSLEPEQGTQRAPEVGQPTDETLVARSYGRRDWFLRRLLALSDVVWLSAALLVATALAGGTPARPWTHFLLFGLLTLPWWVVLFKMYGLYERDAKRLSHTTLDDLPSLFHALLLGCLLLWCYFVVLTPARLTSEAILEFGGIALALVLTGRRLARTVFMRVISPERVLLIGTGDASGALIQKMRAKASLRLKPIGVLSCDRRAAGTAALPLIGCLKDVEDLPALLLRRRVGRIVVADGELEGPQLLDVLRDCKTVAVKVSLLPATFSALGPSVEVDDVSGVTVLGVNPPVLSSSSWLVKRTLDLVGAGLLGVLALPLLLLAAVTLKRDNRGK
jgi:FlaA1/EpsC-like NDP-sugar epimerase